jgi:hypothetical protein
MNESSSCTVPPARAPTAGSRHPATGRPPGAVRWPPTRTTTRPREPVRSRRGRGLTKRREVAPLVGLGQRPAIVRRVRGIHFGGAMASDQCSKRLIDQRGISHPRAHAPGVFEEVRVDGRAQSCASHATSMPQRPDGRLPSRENRSTARDVRAKFELPGASACAGCPPSSTSTGAPGSSPARGSTVWRL